ncbi:MAG: histidine phosphatase family protein [Gemmatimonadales bacterium]|nr:histidine phosphatase family protein [Gemmatimonadales bacterium]
MGLSAGVSLNAIGVRQAEDLADRLKLLPIAAVYSSPMERARETAAPLAGRLNLPVRIASGLNELDFGAWTRRTLDSLKGEPEKRWTRWSHGRAPSWRGSRPSTRQGSSPP